MRYVRRQSQPFFTSATEAEAHTQTYARMHTHARTHTCTERNTNVATVERQARANTYTRCLTILLLLLLGSDLQQLHFNGWNWLTVSTATIKSSNEFCASNISHPAHTHTPKPNIGDCLMYACDERTRT